jgi:hypothetical protein
MKVYTGDQLALDSVLSVTAAMADATASTGQRRDDVVADVPDPFQAAYWCTAQPPRGPNRRHIGDPFGSAADSVATEGPPASSSSALSLQRGMGTDADGLDGPRSAAPQAPAATSYCPDHQRSRALIALTA